MKGKIIFGTVLGAFLSMVILLLTVRFVLYDAIENGHVGSILVAVVMMIFMSMLFQFCLMTAFLMINAQENLMQFKANQEENAGIASQTADRFKEMAMAEKARRAFYQAEQARPQERGDTFRMDDRSWFDE